MPQHPQQQSDLMREILAHDELAKAGSVMAKPQEPKWRQNSPLLGAILDVIDKPTKLISPTDIGGAGKAAQITPSAWKAMQPEAKAMLNNLADKAPEVFQQALKAPHELMAFVRNLPPNVLGRLGTYKAAKGMAEKAGRPELADTASRSVMEVAPTETSKLDTLVHELQHYLGFGKVQKANPEDAGTIGVLLQDLLRGGRQPAGSLNRQIGNWKDAMTRQPVDPARGLNPQGWKSLPPEVKAMLTEGSAAKYKPGMADPLPAGREYYKTGESILDSTNRAMMDEGLAHLAETTARPGTPKSLLDLAQKLGVGMKKPAQHAKRPIGAEIDVLSANAGVSQNQGLVDDVIKALTQGGEYGDSWTKGTGVPGGALDIWKKAKPGGSY